MGESAAVDGALIGVGIVHTDCKSFAVSIQGVSLAERGEALWIS